MPEQPTAPDSLPKYLAEGIPKQDDQTLKDIRAFADALLEYRRQTVDPEELPDSADPVDTESNKPGTVVAETVTCGDDSCHCTDPGGDEHGPYLYRYYYQDGSLTSEYIGKPTDHPDSSTTT